MLELQFKLPTCRFETCFHERLLTQDAVKHSEKPSGFVLFPVFPYKYLVYPVSVDIDDFDYVFLESKFISNLRDFVDMIKNKSGDCCIFYMFEIG